MIEIVFANEKYIYLHYLTCTFTSHLISFEFEACSTIAVEASRGVVTNMFTSRIVQAAFVKICDIKRTFQT